MEAHVCLNENIQIDEGRFVFFGDDGSLNKYMGIHHTAEFFLGRIRLMNVE